MGLSESNLFVSKNFDTCWFGPPSIVFFPVKDNCMCLLSMAYFTTVSVLIPILCNPFPGNIQVWQSNILIQHLSNSLLVRAPTTYAMVDA